MNLKKTISSNYIVTYFEIHLGAVHKGHPQFLGGGGSQLQTFADMRRGGVSGMQTSAFFKKDDDVKFPIKNSKCLLLLRKKYIL